MMHFRFLALAVAVMVSLLFSPGDARAQTACPQGTAPGSATCGPDGGSSGLWTPPPPEPPRIDRSKMHGAIAIGMSSQGKVVASGQYPRSRRDAQRAAVAQCTANGGSDCQPVIDYAEECASIAYRVADPLVTSASKARDRAAAERAARAECEKAGGPCRVAHTHCTRWEV